MASDELKSVIKNMLSIGHKGLEPEHESGVCSCGSDNVTKEQYWIEANTMTEEYKCHDCKQEWNEIYSIHLQSVEITKKGE